MLYRKSYEVLEKWFKESKRAMLIDGARQVGKTTLIREFLKKKNTDYIELNLLDNKLAREAFDTSSSADELMMKLTALADKPVTDATFWFIDEIQEALDAVTPIKFLVSMKKYRFLFSGSLLGIKMKNISSIGTGYVDIHKMYPMDFEEFMLANGVSSKIRDYLEECYQEEKQVDTIIHTQMMKLFGVYLIVGGMPDVVNAYVTTHNIQNVISSQKAIDDAYVIDITKYDYQDKLQIEDIYNLIPSELNSPNKRMILKTLNQKARFYAYEESFAWLKESGVGLFTYNVDNPVYPLLASKERTLFKLFMCDTGLLSYKLLNGNQIDILNGNVNVNYGAIYENVVAQELTAHGFPLYYANNKKRGELDFIIEDGTDILPIEVKSGKDYTRHSAMNNMISDYKVTKGIVFNNDNFKRNGNVIYIPVYMVMFLKKHAETTTGIYIPDLSALTE